MPAVKPEALTEERSTSPGRMKQPLAEIAARTNTCAKMSALGAASRARIRSLLVVPEVLTEDSGIDDHP